MNTKEIKLDPLEFLARLSAHIPNKYEQLVRYYGHYSARTRGRRRKVANKDDTIVLDDIDRPKSINKTWAALIKQVYEVDPLVCEKCGGEMKIIAFITDFTELKKIIANLGLPDFHPPPKIDNCTQDLEPLYDQMREVA